MSQTDLEHKSLPTKQQVQNKFFFRLPSAYISFFQSMADDYYQRGKIKAPSISLLAKTCLITAGNAWNRMMIQIMNKDFERRLQTVEQERQEHQRQQQQQPQNYQQRQEFVHTSGDLMPQSVATKRPLTFVAEETKRRLQQQAGNVVNGGGFTPRLDTKSMTWRRAPQQHQSKPQAEDQFYYDEDYGISQ
jgi:hypothetical protein